jgi:threonyl-tRNA synthetase
MRHSAEHVLHHVMEKLYPGLKAAMGPATEEGFYFDFDPGKHKISEADFPKIEEEMAKIIKKNLPIVRKEITVAQARKLFHNNHYKLEWVDIIEKKGQKAIVYYMGNEFFDLCAGPHVSSTGKIGPFKLLSIAGAYWHGDEKNKMLTRIYGTAFPTQKELDQYLWQQQEAKKRDHRVLGKKLDLFVISDNIGKGLPLLTPKGNLIKKQILDYEYQLEVEYGFQQVSCPHIARSEMYKKTGHWQHYREVMYQPFGIENEEYVLKPMNCPHHYMIYASRPRSWRDLPFRLSEPGTCYRFEKTGELSGLLRVRALMIDDAHILMSENQIEKEYKNCIEMVAKMFKVFGLKDYYVRVSLADPTDAIKYIADKKTWKLAGEKLIKIVKDNKLKYKVVSGEASFYGPKLDYMVKDSLGREWQMSTLQLDLFMGKKLNLIYTDKNGEEKHPVILHRGLTGSIERTLAVLIEHYAGAFPLWLSPVQVMIIPIAERHVHFAKSASWRIKAQNLRVEVDDKNETMQKKIKEAEEQKIPYMLIIGDREVKEEKVAVRKRGEKNLGQMTLDDFGKKIKKEIEEKSLI